MNPAVKPFLESMCVSSFNLTVLTEVSFGCPNWVDGPMKVEMAQADSASPRRIKSRRDRKACESSSLSADRSQQ